MTTLDDPNEEDLKITPPKQWATGVPAVTHAIPSRAMTKKMRLWP